MRCSEVIISATQCVKSPATPCQNVLFRFSTVHFVTPSTPPPDQDLWITKYRAGQNFVPVLKVDLLWTIYQIGHRICLTFACCVCSLLYSMIQIPFKAKVEVMMMKRQRWNIICAAPRSLPKSFLTCLNLSSTFNQLDVYTPLPEPADSLFMLISEWRTWLLALCSQFDSIPSNMDSDHHKDLGHGQLSSSWIKVIITIIFALLASHY